MAFLLGARISSLLAQKLLVREQQLERMHQQQVQKRLVQRQERVLVQRQERRRQELQQACCKQPRQRQR